MEKSISRREILKLGTMAGVVAIGGGLGGSKLIGSPGQSSNAVWPWPLTKKIDDKKAAELSYKNHYIGGCM